jgi:hypothetical protein
MELAGRYSTAKPGIGLPATAYVTMLPAMFVVSEEAAAAIRTAYEQEGELSAAIEVRRLFPGITDNAKARECARTIAGWKPLPGQGDGVGEPGPATANPAYSRRRPKAH